MPTKEEIAKKNISFTSVNEVREICKPLFRRLNINRFSYSIHYSDSYYVLSSNDWSRHYFLMEYPMANRQLPPFCLYLDFDGSNFVHPAAIIHKQETFGLYHSAYICIKRNHYWEFWSFSAPRENYQIIDVYLNKFDLLEKFVMYFKEKACKLIQQAQTNRIMRPVYYQDILSFSSDTEIYTEDQKQFLREIEHKKFYILGNNGEIALTRREFEAFKYNAFGMTAKEIARRLNISPRTAEIYLDRVKQKLGVYTRHQLTELFFNNFRTHHN